MNAIELLGSLLGNNPTSSSVGNNILNELVKSLAGGAGDPARSPLGQRDPLTAGRPAAGGANITALLGNLAVAALQQFAQSRPASSGGQSPLAAIAGSLGLGQPAAAPTPQADRQALALIRAMINSAKADGQIDPQEQQNILSRLTGVGPQELEFIRQEMTKPLNMDFLADVNPAMATDVYMVSLMAVNLDTKEEINYMHQLAQSLGLNAQTVNAIHTQLGLAPFYEV